MSASGIVLFLIDFANGAAADGAAAHCNSTLSAGRWRSR
jgi:hypothetical protein